MHLLHLRGGFERRSFIRVSAVLKARIASRGREKIASAILLVTESLPLRSEQLTLL